MLLPKFRKGLAKIVCVLLGWNAGVAVAQTEFQARDVVEFFGQVADVPTPPNPDFTGAAWLNRSENRIQGRLMTKVARSGYAYTVWVVVFNNPEFCIDECSDSDLGLPEVQGSVYYGNGAISAHSPPGGVINVDLALTDQGLAEGRYRLDDGLPEPIPFWVDGINPDNGLCAEIHLVVDQHETPKRKVQGDQSWAADLTSTVFPGTPFGPEGMIASAHRAAVFPPADACNPGD